MQMAWQPSASARAPAAEVALADIVLAGGRDDHLRGLDLNSHDTRLARFRVQRGFVEDCAQTGLLAHPADRGDDVGLVKIVGQNIDSGLRILFAACNEVE